MFFCGGSAKGRSVAMEDAACTRENILDNGLEISVGGSAGGIVVPSPAEFSRKGSHVDVSPGAEADADGAGLGFLEEDDELAASDEPGEADETFGVAVVNA